MSLDLLLLSGSIGMSLVSGISTALLWIQYLKTARGYIKTLRTDNESPGEDDLYIIGISGRL
jgi:hypothetical protein